MVMDMRTAREQREANTVLAKRAMIQNPAMQLGREQRTIMWIERSSLWSLLGCAAMSLHLSSFYALDTGPVPV
jgi:hypothetical protein